VEGNSYFPIESLNKEYLKDGDTQKACHRKGTASYDDRAIDGKVNQDIAWLRGAVRHSKQHQRTCRALERCTSDQ